MTGKLPTHNVYSVTKRDPDSKGFWLAIGAAWLHRDGDGLTFNSTYCPSRPMLALSSASASPRTKSRPRRSEISRTERLIREAAPHGVAFPLSMTAHTSDQPIDTRRVV
jgi:hypothetical protein